MQEVILGKCAGCIPAEAAVAHVEMAGQQAHEDLDHPPDETERAGNADTYRTMTADGTRLLRCDGSGRTYRDAEEFTEWVCADIRSQAAAEAARVARCAERLRELLASCRGGMTVRSQFFNPPLVQSLCPIYSRLVAIQAEFDESAGQEAL